MYRMFEVIIRQGIYISQPEEMPRGVSEKGNETVSMSAVPFAGDEYHSRLWEDLHG